MTEETNLIERVQKLFNVASADELKSLLDRSAQNKKQNRPNHSKSTNATYYRERYAIELRGTLDEMMAEHAQGIYENRLFRYDESPLSKNSLYLYVQQSRQYLLDNLDPDGKYAKFMEYIRWGKRHGLGIEIKYDRMICSPGTTIRASKVVEEDKQSAVWKDKLDKFLETAPERATLVIDKLALSEEEIAEVESQITGLQNVLFDIKSSRIKIAKLSPAEYQALMK